MKMNAQRQYTVRNIPRSVDEALRKRAAEQNKSLNTILLDALMKEAGLGEEYSFSDLDSFIGSWVKDSKTEKALKDQRRVDPKDWV